MANFAAERRVTIHCEHNEIAIIYKHIINNKNLKPMYFGKKLLIMMALASTAVGANAEIVDGVRQQPLLQK